jgi:hypothetical protein
VAVDLIQAPALDPFHRNLALLGKIKNLFEISFFLCGFSDQYLKHLPAFGAQGFIHSIP